MILNNSPENAAVLSNVSEVNSFSIKATAKSFQILSSGLYANKIKAIIRELSCNAYDSHVAAGKAGLPFEVHLPNKLETWFSIRDYGVGLSHDDVSNIYTTYFESTKTSSNEFVGALGLGSKSPFSYTDNFTVTAIKNGRKGIYSAFINEFGVPSIALMSESPTEELTGVEVKLSVSNADDIQKFLSEAVNVYVWFKTKPKVTGSSVFHDRMQAAEIKFLEMDIIPGVHRFVKAYESRSYAVMGNISYPIDIPNAEMNLGILKNFLGYGLVMNFEIGELDFQASREGLSYNQQTIDAIKIKLELLSGKLYSLFLERAAKVEQNKWIFSSWLIKQSSDKFWKSSALRYAKDNPSDLYTIDHFGQHLYAREISVSESKLQELNIKITSLYRLSKKTIRRYKDYSIKLNYATNNCIFFINDTNKGAVERVKTELLKTTSFYGDYIVIEKIDKTKDMQIDQLFNLIHNPPESLIRKVSELQNLNTTKRKTDVRIVRLVEDRSRNRSFTDLIWREESNLDVVNDPNKEFYYIPLNGFTSVTTKIVSLDFKDAIRRIKSSGLDPTIVVYGVRKADIERVKTMTNWINVEDHIDSLIQKNKEDLLRSSVTIERIYEIMFSNKRLMSALSEGSLFKVTSELVNPKIRYSMYNLEKILLDFDPNFLVEYNNYRTVATNSVKTLNTKYPMLQILQEYRIDSSEKIIADYINLIDKTEEQRKTLCTHI
jgi:hypothetical protein